MRKYEVWFIPDIMGAEWDRILETDSFDEASAKYIELKRQQYACRVVRLEIIGEHAP